MEESEKVCQLLGSGSQDFAFGLEKYRTSMVVNANHSNSYLFPDVDNFFYIIFVILANVGWWTVNNQLLEYGECDPCQWFRVTCTVIDVVKQNKNQDKFINSVSVILFFLEQVRSA